jgi:hypothetical protein
MKTKVPAILALAWFAGSLVVSAADAQTNRQRVNPAAAASRAQVPPRAFERQPESPAVYEWGKYQGQDPDPNVRLQLRRDYHN